MEQLKKESGRLSSTEQKSVEDKIKAKLNSGNYATMREGSNGANQEGETQ